MKKSEIDFEKLKDDWPHELISKKDLEKVTRGVVTQDIVLDIPNEIVEGEELYSMDAVISWLNDNVVVDPKEGKKNLYKLQVAEMKKHNCYHL